MSSSNFPRRRAPFPPTARRRPGARKTRSKEDAKGCRTKRDREGGVGTGMGGESRRVKRLLPCRRTRGGRGSGSVRGAGSNSESRSERGGEGGTFFRVHSFVPSLPATAAREERERGMMSNFNSHWALDSTRQCYCGVFFALRASVCLICVRERDDTMGFRAARATRQKQRDGDRVNVLFVERNH